MSTEKRTHILTTAARLFSQQGIRSITMDDIAREAGVSKKTIYSFYNNKQELVEAFVKHFIFDCPELQFNIRPNINAIDQLFKYREKAAVLLELVKNKIDYDLKRLYPEIHRELQTFKRDLIYRIETALLAKGKQEGLFRPELDDDFVARMSVGRSLLIFNPENDIFTDEECLNMATFDKMLDFQLHAICTPRGIDYYEQELNHIRNEN
ncbi:TetR/AcrR family transcriptional regulator [Mangrovibacterium marinum]|uniref:TetR family transcriptional regulator n=1 Tax=Mangrovibacterium marinum TaxID=1639118 RepID=A0A2T5C6L6_9BACT|nr:TetR/AcrR family transcriptional regulator [Mangrovibacterium marinum]PTN10576.1 TetR family transcriptional regulator [Mangrovibacterium marinum]